MRSWLDNISQLFQSDPNQSTTGRSIQIGPEGLPMNKELLEQIVEEIVSTRPDEIGCDDCFDQLDQFVEFELAGKNAAEALPLVQDHLKRCKDCHEEFEALLRALEATAM